ncbi:MAG: hypothetical protein EBT69_06085 [Verrucomicrobia bacterium]|nr:hypothetical protein [Verrucomicrobiota bacterium]
MADRSAHVGSPLRILTMPELNMSRARRNHRAHWMRRGGASDPAGRGRSPGFSRRIRRKPVSRRRVSHWNDRKSWPILTKESQQSHERAAENGRINPRVSAIEDRRPRIAMRRREVSDAPTNQAIEGRVKNGDGEPVISMTRWRRFWAGRMPSGPMSPGIWK